MIRRKSTASSRNFSFLNMEHGFSRVFRHAGKRNILKRANHFPSNLLPDLQYRRTRFPPG